ncbi:hypothetical protein AB0A70_07345 [Streptomyces morookaense]|uniref:hypothetical protein n=1 Tax=Streptomyces morookaense TaxID=1970 RepID=UPI00340E8613
MGFGSRRVAAALCGLVLLTGSSSAAAPPALAHEPVLCLGSENTAFFPGLSLTPRPTQIDGHASYSCSGGAAEPVAAGGHIHGEASAASCVDVHSLPAQPKPSKEIVHYADGAKSVIDYTSAPLVTRVAGALVLTLHGPVVAGRGKDAEATRTITLLPGRLPTTCLAAEGLGHFTGPVSLLIAPRS